MFGAKSRSVSVAFSVDRSAQTLSSSYNAHIANRTSPASKPCMPLYQTGSPTGPCTGCRNRPKNPWTASSGGRLQALVWIPYCAYTYSTVRVLRTAFVLLSPAESSKQNDARHNGQQGDLQEEAVGDTPANGSENVRGRGLWLHS